MGDARETAGRTIFEKLAHEGIDTSHLTHMLMTAAAALNCTRFGGAFAAPQRADVEQLLSQDQTAPATQARR
jgi:hypothetical protein